MRCRRYAPILLIAACAGTAQAAEQKYATRLTAVAYDGAIPIMGTRSMFSCCPTS